MHSPPAHIVAVMGIVINPAGQVLLVQTERRGWEPPGGQVEVGENLVEALKREILEESSCTVDVEKLIGIYSNVAQPPKLIVSFACSHLQGEPRPSVTDTEILDANWFTAESALIQITNPIKQAMLHDALKKSESIVYRAYTTIPSYRVLCEEDF